MDALKNVFEAKKAQVRTQFDDFHHLMDNDRDNQRW